MNYSSKSIETLISSYKTTWDIKCVVQKYFRGLKWAGRHTPRILDNYCSIEVFI